MSYWYSPRVKGGRKCLIFYAPPWARASGRPLHNVFITLHLFGPPAAPARPHRRRRPERGPAFLGFFYGATNKDSWAGRSGSSRALTQMTLAPGSSHGAGLGQRVGAAGRGRVTGLGPHERRLRRGLQPREERNGFKSPQQTNPCYPAGAPRHAASRAGLLRPAGSPDATQPHSEPSREAVAQRPGAGTGFRLGNFRSSPGA